MTDFNSNSTLSKDAHRVPLLPAVSNYLSILNHHLLPAFIKSGSLPNAINAREGLANLTQLFVTEVVDVPLIIDDMITHDDLRDDALVNSDYEVPVRIFCPRSSIESPLPVMLYFHGGGGSAGSVSVYQQILCRLAKYTNHIIVAPEYRLAPENPYPCAQNDARTVLFGVSKVLARRQIATTAAIVVAGDSHGGAIVTNLLRDSIVVQSGRIQDISAQVLIYPSVDFTMSCPSIDTYATGYLLSKTRIQWYFDQYFQNHEDFKAHSALFASMDELKNQPPALIINAAVDPLYDEGVLYADTLTSVGIKTKHITYHHVIHAYLNMENLNPEVCMQTYHAIATFLDDTQE